MNRVVLETPLTYLFGFVFLIFSFTEGDHADPRSFKAQAEWDNFEEICEALKLKFSIL